MIGERLVGTLELASRSRVAFDHEDMALLQILAAQLGIAIENARLQQTQSERAAELSGLQQIASVMTSMRDPRQMYSQLTSRIAVLTDVEMCGVLLEVPDQEALIGQPPFYGVPEQIVAMYRIPINEGSIGAVLYRTRDWWYSNAVLSDEIVREAGLTNLAEAVGVRTTALVQMSVGNRRFGVIQVANKRDGKGFTDNDMRLLSVFASQAAIVVENARLYDEERRRSEELGGLQQVAQAIGMLHSPDEMYSYLNEQIAKLMNCQMCGILLYEPSLNQLISRPPFYGVDDDLIRHYRIALTPGTTFHRIYNENDYWISNELRADPALRDSGLDKLAMLIGVRQTLFVPLIIRGRRIGVVQVSNRLDGAPFTEEQARVLSIIASQVAVIIDNARLYREMRERTDESEACAASPSWLPATCALRRSSAASCARQRACSAARFARSACWTIKPAHWSSCPNTPSGWSACRSRTSSIPTVPASRIAWRSRNVPSSATTCAQTRACCPPTAKSPTASASIAPCKCPSPCKSAARRADHRQPRRPRVHRR